MNKSENPAVSNQLMRESKRDEHVTGMDAERLIKISRWSDLIPG